MIPEIQLLLAVLAVLSCLAVQESLWVPVIQCFLYIKLPRLYIQ